jgi:iron complex outermembrane receptor protein
MKIVKILGLICFLTIGIWAQDGYQSIEVTVTDAQGRAIKGAIVTITSKTYADVNLSGETDEKGFRSFYSSLIKPGIFIVSASYSLNGELKSSAPVEVPVTLNRTSIVNLQIGEGGTIREEVSVIASGTNQTIDEVSKTVNVIDGQEMRERADFALIDALRTIPGFRVQQLGGFGRTATIKTRGLRNQDTAILIDGIRFRDASAITGDASAFLSDFTLTSVSRIEVLRGSGSSLYGTNAIGGTIDFQTPKPQPGLHGQISGALGSLGLRRFRGNLSDGTKDGKFGFNVGVSRTLYTEGIDGEDDARNTNFQSRVEYNPFEKTNLSGRFFISDAFVRLNSNPDTLGALPASNAVVIDARPGVNFLPDANDPDNFQKSHFFSGQFVVTQIVNSKLFFQGSYQGLKTGRRNTNGILGGGFQPFGGDETSIFEGLIQTANARLNWTPNRTHEIALGYEYEREKFGNDGFTPGGFGNFSTRARQASNTLYAQDSLSFFDNRLQIAGGVRAQLFSLENPSFSASNAPYSNLSLENPPAAYTFDGAASYFFAASGTKIRAHVGNGYRVPSLYERFGTFYSSFSQNFIALGDPNLKPERSIAFDGGIEQNLFKNRAKLSAVYFYTRLTDTIGFGSVAPNIGTTPRPFGGYINTKGGIARGAEFSGRVRAGDSTDVFASYTFTNSDQREPQVAGSRIVETLGVPKHQFTLTATQRFRRAWVNFDFLAASDYLAPIFSNSNFNTYVYRFGGNRRADLTAGYTFPLRGEKLNLRVFGTIENLFGHEYYENGFRAAGRTARGGLALSF